MTSRSKVYEQRSDLMAQLEREVRQWANEANESWKIRAIRSFVTFAFKTLSTLDKPCPGPAFGLFIYLTGSIICS
jgi:hypothetical protein